MKLVSRERGTRARIRGAKVEDTPVLVQMACQFIATSSYRGEVAPNPTHQARLIAHLLQHGAIFIAVRPDGELQIPVGFIAFALTPAVLTGELTACEIAWWVDPDHRASGAGLRLLLAGEIWARLNQATSIQMIAPVGPDPSDDAYGVGKIYRRRGYRPLEVCWTKRLAA